MHRIGQGAYVRVFPLKCCGLWFGWWAWSGLMFGAFNDAMYTALHGKLQANKLYRKPFTKAATGSFITRFQIKSRTKARHSPVRFCAGRAGSQVPAWETLPFMLQLD